MTFASGKEYRVVLDACVLAPMPLCDTLLRCAEEPALYRVLWSEQTLLEVDRTLQKFGYSLDQAARRIRHMREAFPEATLFVPRRLLDLVAEVPDPNDRHVASAAIHARAAVIVTANLRHFPQEALAPYDILVQSPDDFLARQLHLKPERVLEVLDAQANVTRQTLSGLLDRLSIGLPKFAGLVRRRSA